MADRSPLLNQLDRNSRLVLEDVYSKVEKMHRTSKVSFQTKPTRTADLSQLQSTPNVRYISTIVVETGTNRVDMAALNTNLENLAAELEIMRQGLNSALIALRQLSG
jgi:hypothetical protein